MKKKTFGLKFHLDESDFIFFAVTFITIFIIVPIAWFLGTELLKQPINGQPSLLDSSSTTGISYDEKIRCIKEEQLLMWATPYTASYKTKCLKRDIKRCYLTINGESHEIGCAPKS